MSSAVLNRLKDEYGAVRAALPPGVIGAERRREALEALCAQGLPAARDENWRYTDLRILEQARFAPAQTQAAALPPLPEVPEGFARYVFVDGRLHSGAGAAHGVTVHTARTDDASAAAWRLEARLPEARLALLNETFATDAVSIEVAAGTQAAGIELVFIASAAATEGASYPRVRLALGADSRLSVIERHLGRAEAPSLVTSAVQVDLAPHAVLTHYRVQQLGAQAAWFDTLSAELAADARYEMLAVGAGALSARSTVHARLSGRGAEFSLAAAALAEGQQSLDLYALSEHVAPRTRTEQTFRGIASNRSRAAFNGKVVVREEARGTDSRQSLRGLLDGAQCEVDLRPQLEIYTDEVSCSHGATAGKLDENMLFYLLSRGIAPEAAQHLLKWAFLEDVIAKITPSDLRRQIETTLLGQMRELETLKELL
ncbi:MAG: SufD family Fe-S cluster assembly protein [Gammaproteobacteria bacterium]|nr:SufD family Fe-S cluster assembly protein [Gammaproteobacteria bacterium]